MPAPPEILRRGRQIGEIEVLGQDNAHQASTAQVDRRPTFVANCGDLTQGRIRDIAEEALQADGKR